MKYGILLTTLITLAGNTFADSHGGKPPIESGMLQPSPMMTTETPASSAQELRCQQMLREIDSLKGKPVRRGALIEQYNAECKTPLAQ